MAAGWQEQAVPGGSPPAKESKRSLEEGAEPAGTRQNARAPWRAERREVTGIRQQRKTHAKAFVSPVLRVLRIGGAAPEADALSTELQARGADHTGSSSDRAGAPRSTDVVATRLVERIETRVHAFVVKVWRTEP